MGYTPKYKITDSILYNVSQTMAIRQVIEQSRITSRWEKKLKASARLRGAVYSTSIDGNNTGMTAAKRLAGDRTAPRDNDELEIVNYIKALDSVPAYSENKGITFETLADINRSLSNNRGRDAQDVGGKAIGNDSEKAVRAFLDWMNSGETAKVNPLILAALAHIEIYRLRPFASGNAKTARLAAALILYRSGFDIRRLFAPEDYYVKNITSYRAALSGIDGNNGDMTQWIEYYTSGILYSVSGVRAIVSRIARSPKDKMKRWLRLRFTAAYITGTLAVIFTNSSDRSMVWGIGFIIAGLLIRIWANVYVIKSEHLTTSGPYSIIRHPLYLGSLLLLAGFAIMLNTSFAGLAFLAIFAIIYYRKAKCEEEMLEERFKDMYTDYKKHVPALFPTIFPYRGGEKISFNLGRFMKSQEYKLIIWTIIIIFFFYIKGEILVERERFDAAIWRSIVIMLMLGIFILVDEMLRLIRRRHRG